MKMVSRIENLQPGMVAVVGIPFDDNSSFMQGPSLAPAKIRKAWNSGSMNLCAESGIDLDKETHFVDLGDLDIAAAPAIIEKIETAIAELLDHNIRIISLG